MTNVNACEKTVPPPPFPLNGRPRGTSYSNRGVGEASNPNLPHSHCPTRKKKKLRGWSWLKGASSSGRAEAAAPFVPFRGGLPPPSANIPTTPFLPSFLPSPILPLHTTTTTRWVLNPSGVYKRSERFRPSKRERKKKGWGSGVWVPKVGASSLARCQVGRTQAVSRPLPLPLPAPHLPIARIREGGRRDAFTFGLMPSWSYIVEWAPLLLTCTCDNRPPPPPFPLLAPRHCPPLPSRIKPLPDLP